MAATRKRLTTTASLSNTTQANNTTIQARIKHAVCILALWGIISPKSATEIIRTLGLSHA